MYGKLRRYEHYTNNIVESANNMLSDARFLNYFRCVVWMYQHVLSRFSMFAKKYPPATSNMQTVDIIRKKMNDNIKLATEYDVVLGANATACVTHKVRKTSTVVQHGSVMLCGCGDTMYGNGIHCGHLLATLISLKRDVWGGTAYLSDYCIQNTFALLPAVYTTDDLERSDLKPPVTKRARGRPKTKRYKSALEGGQGSKKRVMTCGRCGKTGHQQRTCKEPMNEPQLSAAEAAIQVVLAGNIPP